MIFTDLIKSPRAIQDQSSDLVTPKDLKSLAKRPPAPQKKLMIYETYNAYDMLMNEAMLQSKQLMEKCN